MTKYFIHSSTCPEVYSNNKDLFFGAYDVTYLHFLHMNLYTKINFNNTADTDNTGNTLQTRRELKKKSKLKTLQKS